MGSKQSKIFFMIQTIRQAVIVGFVLLAGVGSVSDVQAQFSVGVRAGGHISRYLFSDPLYEEAVQYRGYFQAAVPVELSLTESLSLQAELQYLQKGVRLFSRDQTDYSDYRINNHVLEIPLLIKKNFSEWESELSLFAGPALAWYLTGRVRHDYTQMQVPGKENERIDYKGYNRWDLDLQLGGEFAWPVGDEMELFLDARYHLGLLNFDYLASVEADRIRARGISLSFGARRNWE